MKNCYFLMLAVFFIMSFCNGQEDNKKVIVLNFITSLASEDISYDLIAKEFISLQSIPEGKKNEALHAIKTVLNEHRQALQRSGGPDKIEVVLYNDEFKRKNLIIPKDQISNTYLVLDSQSNLLFPVLVDKGKIIAFSTFTKGDNNTLYPLYW